MTLPARAPVETTHSRRPSGLVRHNRNRVTKARGGRLPGSLRPVRLATESFRSRRGEP